MSVQQLLGCRFGQNAKKVEIDIKQLTDNLNHNHTEDKVYFHDDKISVGIKDGQEYLVINKENCSNIKPKKQSRSNENQNGHNVIFVEKFIEVPVPTTVYKEIEKIVQVEKFIEVIKQIQIPVEKIIQIEKIIQVQKIKEIPVQVTIEKPIYIDRIIQIEKRSQQANNNAERIIQIEKIVQIEKIIQIPVIEILVIEKPVPIQVQKTVYVEKIIQKPIEKVVVVEKIIQVEKIIEVEVPIEKIIQIEKIVEVPVEKIVNLSVEKIIHQPKIIQIEKIVQKTVEIPVEIIIQKPVQRIIEKIIQKPIFIEKQIQVQKIVQKPTLIKQQPIIKYITIEKIVEVPVEKIIYIPVEKIIQVQIIKEVEKIIEIVVEKIIEKPVEKIVEIQKTVYIERGRATSRQRNQFKLPIDSQNILSQRNQYGTAEKRKTFSQKDMPQDDISFKSSSRGYSSRQIDCSAHKMIDKGQKKKNANEQQLQDQILNLKEQLRIANQKIQEYQYENIKQNEQQLQQKIKQIEELQQQQIAINEKLQEALMMQNYLEKDNDLLKSTICNLQAQNDEFSIKFREKQEIIQKLIKENQFLLKQIENCKITNQKNKAQSQEGTIKLIQELNRERQENYQLANRFTMLNQSLANAKEQIQELKNTIENLQEYNRGLSSIIQEKAQIEEELVEQLHNLKNQRHQAQTTMNEEASQQILRLNEENQELTQSLKQAYQQIRQLQQHSLLLESKQQQFQNIIEKVNKIQRQIGVEEQEYENHRKQQKQQRSNQKALMGSKSAGFLVVDEQLLNQEAEQQQQLSNFRSDRKKTDEQIEQVQEYINKKQEKSDSANKRINNFQSNKMIEQLLSELQKQKYQQKQLHNMIQKVKTQLVHSQREVYQRNQTIDNLNVLLTKKQNYTNGDNQMIIEQFNALKTQYAKLQRENKDLRESVDRLHQNITDIHDGKHFLSSNLEAQIYEETTQISLEAFVQQYLENDRVTLNLSLKIFEMFIQQIANENYKSYQPRNLLVMTNSVDLRNIISVKVVAGSHKAFGQSSKIQFIAPELLENNDKNKPIVFNEASAVWNAALLIDFVLCKQAYFKNMQEIRQFKDKYILKNKKYNNLKPTLQIMLCKNPKQRTPFDRIADILKQKLLEK